MANASLVAASRGELDPKEIKLYVEKSEMKHDAELLTELVALIVIGTGVVLSIVLFFFI